MYKLFTFFAALIIAALALAESEVPNYAQGIDLYQSGDVAGAVDAFERGVQAGEPAAMSALGTHYLNGEGIEQDVERGIALLEQSVAQGDVLGHASLAFINAQGVLGEPNFSKAFEYATVASQNCIPAAQDLLAKLYYYGDGTEQSIVDALAWLYMAASLNHPDASEGISMLEVEATAAQTTQATAKYLDHKKGMACVNF